MKRKSIIMSLMLMLAVCFVVGLTPVETYAATSAKKILSKSATSVKKAKSISFRYELIRNYADSKSKQRSGMCVSDNDVNYGIYIDLSQTEQAWYEYRKKDKNYRKAYNSSSWDVYTNSDYNGKNVWERSAKSNVYYTLTHMKSVKLKSMSSKSYVITGKLSFGGYKNATVMVDKKTNKVLKIRYGLKKATYSYLNSSNTYTVTGGICTLSNISYGNEELSLPAELRGR